MRDLFLSLGLAFVPVSITLAALWLSARARALRAEETIRQIALGSTRPATPPGAPAPDAAPTLDAILLEVERIAESQRFTTKLLAERNEVLRGQAQVPAITPH